MKHALSVVGISFVGAILFTATVQNLAMLTLAFVGLRMLGQGSMTLIGTTGVVMWFERRRGLALAISGTGSVALVSLSPLTFAWLISRFGWRTSWVVIGVAVLIVLVPIARLAIVDRPATLRQIPDGEAGKTFDSMSRQPSHTVAEAVRTPAFWSLTAITFMAGAISTALTFHNTDLLGDQGLSRTEAAAIFVPLLVGSVSSRFVIGWLTDRLPARPLMFFAGVALSLGTLLATLASPGFSAVAYGLMLGVGAGSIGALGGALYPKWFGVENIGSIRGIATTANVGATAIGPLILSIGNDLADSYQPIVVASAIVSLVVALAALVVPVPSS